MNICVGEYDVIRTKKKYIDRCVVTKIYVCISIQTMYMKMMTISAACSGRSCSCGRRSFDKSVQKEIETSTVFSVQ